MNGRIGIAILAAALGALAQTAPAPTKIELTQIANYTAVRNEVPAAGAAAGTWTLAAAPVAGVACYRNGLRQAPGNDYTLVTSTISSLWWLPGDSLLCDYEHR